MKNFVFLFGLLLLMLIGNAQNSTLLTTTEWSVAPPVDQPSFYFGDQYSYKSIPHNACMVYSKSYFPGQSNADTAIYFFNGNTRVDSINYLNDNNGQLQVDSRVVLTYNNNGKRITDKVFVRQNNQWLDTLTSYYTFTNSGKIKTSVGTHKISHGAPLDTIDRHTYYYDQAGRDSLILQEFWLNSNYGQGIDAGARWVFSYIDSNGQSSVIRQSYHKNDMSWKNQEKRIAYRDIDSNIIEEKIFDFDPTDTSWAGDRRKTYYYSQSRKPDSILSFSWLQSSWFKEDKRVLSYDNSNHIKSLLHVYYTNIPPNSKDTFYFDTLIYSSNYLNITYDRYSYMSTQGGFEPLYRVELSYNQDSLDLATRSMSWLPTQQSWDTATVVNYKWDQWSEFYSSINDVPIPESVIFPNPAQNRAYLQFSEPLVQPLPVKCYNVKGQLIKQFKLPPGQIKYRLPVPGERGLYFYRFQQNGQTITKRVMGGRF